MTTSAQSNYINMFAILGKVSTTLLKLAKSLKFILAAGTFGAYTFIFTWKFALLVMFGIGIHEMGHVSAMRWHGLKTKGFYFIPLVGGAAISEEEFRSGREEAWVALWGPIFGLLTLIPPLILYYITKNAMWAAAASWLSAVNLFNLFPVNPLDGGRVVKALVFSFDSRLGLGFLLFGFALAIYLSITLELGLLLFIAIIGMLEIKPVSFFVFVIMALCVCLVAALWFSFRFQFDRIVPMFIYMKDYCLDIWNKPKPDKGKEFWELDLSSKIQISTVFVGLILIFVSTIFLLSDIPGADIAMQFLKDE